jgi:ATP-dependent exoDNAse (exonuclease V) alpha subunit
VVLVINEEAKFERSRERLYVGLSRARDQLVVCGVAAGGLYLVPDGHLADGRSVQYLGDSPKALLRQPIPIISLCSN